MAIPFSGIVTPMSVAFTGPDGKMHNVTNAHINYENICATMKKLQVAMRSDDDAEAVALHYELAELAEPAKQITLGGGGRVAVRDGVVLYQDQPVNNAVTERILWGLREGYDMKPYLTFLDNLMDNPSKRAVDELYSFIEKHKLGISDDGQIIAYKRVRDDYKDIHSGSFDNSPGQVLEMPRNKVDDDKNRTCSQGFHFCAFEYLPHFGAGSGNRLVIVKVNPRDVVSIPADHNDAKARACRYEVIGEYEGDDKLNILGTKAVWTQKDWTPSEETDDDSDYYSDEYGYGDDVDDEDEYGAEDEVVDDEYSDAYDVAEEFRHGWAKVVTYVYSSNGSILSAVVDWDSGRASTIVAQDALVALELGLLNQAANGRKAKIKINNGPLQLGD